MRLEEAFNRTALSEVVSYDIFRETCPTAHVAMKRPGQTIFAAGEGAKSFAFLVSGRVKLVKPRADGRESILDFVDISTLLCPSMPHREGSYCCQAVAASHATRILVVNREEAFELARTIPGVLPVFLDLLAERTARMCARVAELSAGRVRRRIAGLFLRLSQLGSREEEEGTVRIELRLSRRELAELTGTTVESATRAARELERDGVLSTESWGFRVLKEEALRVAAEGL